MSQRAYTRRKSKGLIAQIQELILQPIAFYESLPENDSQDRSWLWIAILILGLLGYSAVLQAGLMPSDEFGTGGAGLQEQLIVGLTAASGLLFAWILQSLLFIPLAILNQENPRFGLNWQVVIWASLPYAIMSILQIAYLWAGETISSAGILSLMQETLPPDFFASNFGAFMSEIFKQLSFFGLWNIVLLYLGARHSLKGKSWAIIGLLVLWLFLLIFIPTAMTISSQPPPPLDDLPSFQ